MSTIRVTRFGWQLLFLSVLLLCNVSQAEINFSDSTDYMAGSWPTQIAKGDFNGDSYPDLAVSNYISSTISIMLNSGSGEFQTVATLDAGMYPNGILAVNLDSDSDLDLVYCNGSESNNTISVMLNSGNGQFQSRVTYTVGTFPHLLDAADLDGDGDRDLAVVSHNTSRVYVLLNSGGGTFSTGGNFVVGSLPVSVTAADLDGDTDLDLAVGNSGASNVSILMNDGSANFAPAVSYAAGNSVYSVFASDFDSDGDQDLAAANQNSATVSVLTNDGSGIFGPPTDYPVGAGPRCVLGEDFDNDGDIDLAATASLGNDVTILANNGTGVFLPTRTYPLRSQPMGITSLDADLDGDLDLAFGYTASDNITILANLASAPCTDFNSSADWQQHLMSLGGSQVTSSSTYHSSDASLACSGTSSLVRTDLIANKGEFGIWMNQQSYHGDMRLFIQVLPMGNDPNSATGYVLILSGLDAEVPRFILSKYVSGIPDTLLNQTPQFAMNEWIKMFIYRGEGGDLVVGYERTNGCRDVMKFVDPNPLTDYGHVYFWTYAPDQPNFFDDACFDANAPAPYVYVYGDADGSGIITISDAVYLINYIFAGGSVPNPLIAGDADCSGFVNISDAVYLINFIFGGGPVPCANCGVKAPKLASGSADISTTPMTNPTATEVAVNLSTSTEARAVQLDFNITGNVSNIKIASSVTDLQLFSGEVDGGYRMGLIDLTGTAAIPSGKSQIATITYEGDGELTVSSAIVVDNDAAEMNVEITNSKLESVLPTEYSLSQNQPNPFNPSTDISFSLPKTGQVKLVVYNILGAEVATLVDEVRSAGVHRVSWNGTNSSGQQVASGIYLYRLTAGDFAATKKMLLLK